MSDNGTAEIEGLGTGADHPDAASWIVHLSDKIATDANQVGGKGMNLALLLQAGFRVPPGFCITTAAFDLKSATSVFPPSLRQAIINAFQLQGVDRRYAVRSSATVEDASDRSFAGLFESYLNVTGEEGILAAVQACWRSLDSERARTYLSRNGMASEKARMGVVIQEMVDADYAGVLFTANPLTGATDRTVIEYVAGLGESLVQGTAQPVRIELTNTTPLPGNSPVQLEKLLTIANQVVQLMGMPQDIEWAQSVGEIYLLQARPITVFQRTRPAPTQKTTTGSSSERKNIVWSNLNLVENVPRVATPMTWSILDYCQRKLFGPVFKLVGYDVELDPWLGRVAGRVYCNAGIFLALQQQTPGLRDSKLDWLFGGHQDELLKNLSNISLPDSLKKGRRNTVKVVFHSLPAVLSMLWRTQWGSNHTSLRTLRAFVNHFSKSDYQRLTESDLYALIPGMQKDVSTRLSVPVPFLVGAGFHAMLRNRCRHWFKDAHGVLANELISLAGGMASAEPALELWQLASWITGKNAIREQIAKADHFDPLPNKIGNTSEGQEFLRRWTAFMARHGHHASGEADVAIERWAETPDVIMHWLQTFLTNAANQDVGRSREQRIAQREHVLKECLTKLRMPWNRWWFGFLVRQTQAWVVFRENFKSEAVRGMAALRNILRELGTRLAQRGVIAKPGDVFFLTLEELHILCTQPAQPIEIRNLIQTRREEFLENQSLNPPSVVVGTFDPHQPSSTVLAKPGLKEWIGVPVSSGIVTGRVRVLLEPNSGEKLLPGEILVAPFTDPGWTPHFLTAGGMVIEIGGQLSHGSVIAREYGLPAVVNVPNVTRTLRTGQLIRVDGDRGVITLLAETNR